MIAAVKDLAIELGRTPTKQECRDRIRGFKHWILKAPWNGDHSAFIIAAGLTPTSNGRLKLTNEIFERPVAEVIAEHVPREEISQPILSPTLLIGDTHFPFVSKSWLEWLYRQVEKLKPARVIQLGDLYDMYAASKFPRSLNVYTPDDEEDAGRAGAEEMWKTVKRLVPAAECFQLLGNHDLRPVRRTMETAPIVERAVKKHLEGLMTFDGVTTIQDARQELIIDGVMHIHGYRTQLGAHRDYAVMNSACGHSHKGGTVFRRFRGQTFWELNAGFGGDAESKALGYTPQKIHDCTLGLGFYDEFGPRFIPFQG